MKRFAFCITLATSIGVGHAQDGYPISTDRASFSDGTGIIPNGRWQIETGYTFTKVGSTEFHTLGELLFRVPLSEQLELRLSNISLGRANIAGGGGSGLLDPVLGIKYRFQSGVSGRTPDLALIAQTTLPMGSSDFRVRRSQPSLRFAGYYQIDAVNGAGWTLAYSNLGASGAAFSQWAAGAYWARTLNSRSGAFAEVYHIMPTSTGGPNATFVDAGVSYLLDQATQVDFRLGTGLNQRRDGWFIGAGISFRF